MTTGLYVIQERKTQNGEIWQNFVEGEVGYIQRLYGIFISSREKTGQVW